MRLAEELHEALVRIAELERQLEEASSAVDWQVDQCRALERVHGVVLLPGQCIDDTNNVWNPLEDDGDALRLAVQLNLLIQFNTKHVFVFDSCGNQLAFLGKKSDPFAATRRAIVRAAAALGEGEKKCLS